MIPVTAFFTVFLIVALGQEFVLHRWQRLVVFLLIAATGSFAVLGTRDYMEWNRTRWKALNDLLAQKEVLPKDVDGGFEYNGWYLYDHFIQTNGWAIKGTYVITFGAIDGYETVSRHGYQRWLPLREDHVLTLKRQAGD